MTIDSQQFCALSTSTTWLNWLREHHQTLFDELMLHHKSGKSCTENKYKMQDILHIILKSDDDTVELIKFLQQYYPYLIKDDVLEVTSSSNKHGVFDFYDPSLRTFPRRMILEGEDVRAMVQEFCADKAFCDHLIIDNVAYIEYLPMELSKLKDKIPPKNWQVDIYRRKHKR